MIRKIKASADMVQSNFWLRKEDLEKLKQYCKQIPPKHIRISRSEIIRYMIDIFDLEKAKKNFFKAR
jgi:hypothetical protein